MPASREARRALRPDDIMTIRLGAVSSLDARPLVHGLDAQGDRFSIRFDVPSKCATFLHEKAIDVGLIPPIEYLHSPRYQIVPGVAMASEGEAASVALFSPLPTTAIRSIAIDSGLRTSAALLRVLCAEWFDIEPKLLTLPPDLPSMLKRCDAALLTGDAAFFTDHDALGLEKVDLGGRVDGHDRLAVRPCGVGRPARRAVGGRCDGAQ